MPHWTTYTQISRLIFKNFEFRWNSHSKKNTCKLTAKEREWEKLGNTVIGHSAVIPCNIFSNTFSLSSKRHSYLRRDDVYEFSKKRTQKKNIKRYCANLYQLQFRKFTIHQCRIHAFHRFLSFLRIVASIDEWPLLFLIDVLIFLYFQCAIKMLLE